MAMPSKKRPQHLLSQLHGPADVKALYGTRAAPIQRGSVLELVATPLSSATLWVFIGYSLPDYDHDMIDLLALAFEHAPDPEIQVVGWEPDFRGESHSPICRRYREVLRRDFRYFPRGAEAWIAENIPPPIPAVGTED